MARLGWVSRPLLFTNSVSWTRPRSSAGVQRDISRRGRGGEDGDGHGPCRPRGLPAGRLDVRALGGLRSAVCCLCYLCLLKR